MKKIFNWIICLFLIFTIYVPLMVGADSGWDSDYGGSDWDSSSSWDNDSSWSSSSSRDSYGSSDSSVDSSAIELLFCAAFYIFILYLFLSSGSKKKSTSSEDYSHKKYVGDSDIEIQKYFPDMTEQKLIDLLYQKFVDIQVAWMNFDYDALQRLCSEELYQSYRSDLEVLKQSHGQNIMSDFMILSANINGIKRDGDFLIINMYLHAAFYDYVIDTNNQHIEKGTNEKRLHNQYQLEFIVQRNTLTSKCPSCGAALGDSVGKCPYCQTVIERNYTDFVLNRKKKI